MRSRNLLLARNIPERVARRRAAFKLQCIANSTQFDIIIKFYYFLPPSPAAVRARYFGGVSPLVCWGERLKEVMLRTKIASHYSTMTV